MSAAAVQRSDELALRLNAASQGELQKAVEDAEGLSSVLPYLRLDVLIEVVRICPQLVPQAVKLTPCVLRDS